MFVSFYAFSCLFVRLYACLFDCVHDYVVARFFGRDVLFVRVFASVVGCSHACVFVRRHV